MHDVCCDYSTNEIYNTRQWFYCSFALVAGINIGTRAYGSYNYNTIGRYGFGYDLNVTVPMLRINSDSVLL